jgi:hypothetical protein
MIYQFGGGQSERVGLSERVALQKFEVSLLAPLPIRDVLEILDVPVG